MMNSDADYNAQMDLDAMKRADEVRTNPQRMANIQRFLHGQAQAANDMLNKMRPETKGFNKSVRGSKMNGKT